MSIKCGRLFHPVLASRSWTYASRGRTRIRIAAAEVQTYPPMIPSLLRHLPRIRFAGLSALILSCALTGSRPAGGAPSVSSEWFVKNWSVDEGFPGSSVFTISQSSDGYLWLGAKDRLVRFDGVRFVEIGSDH